MSGLRLADLSAEELWLVVDGLHDAIEGRPLDPRLRACTRALGEMSTVLGCARDSDDEILADAAGL